MSEASIETVSTDTSEVRRRPWTLPRLAELPKLTMLTLASAIGGGGSTTGSGSTVFGILLALVALTGCMSDETLEPSAVVAPLGQVVSCRATVATGMVDCGGPSAISTPELFGRQGGNIALRSTNISYDGTTFQFDVTLQNLTAQTIGTTGSNNTGFNVFFESGPTSFGGSGADLTVGNADGTDGTFTGSGQSYFHYADSLAPGQVSPARTWQILVPPSVPTFTFTVRVSADVPDLGGVEVWEELPFFNGAGFTDIAVNSATDAMAVGAGGVTMRKVGTVWHRLPSQIAGDWVGVEAIGGGRYIGATAQGQVARYENNVWRVIATVPFGIQTLAAYGDSNRVVAGGDSVAWWGSNSFNIASLGNGNPWVHSAFYNGGAEWMVASSSGNKRRGSFISGATTSSSASSLTALAGKGGSPFLIAGKATEVVDPVLNTTFDAPFAGHQVIALTFGDGGVGAEFWAASQSGTSTNIASRAAGAWTSRATIDTLVTEMVDDSAGGIYFLSADGIRRWDGSAVVDELVAPAGGVPTAVGALGGELFVGRSDGMIWHRSAAGNWSGAPTTGGSEIRSITVFGANSAVAQDANGGVHTWDGASWVWQPLLPGPIYAGFFPNLTQGVAIGELGSFGPVIWTFDVGGSGSGYSSGLAPQPLYGLWGMGFDDFWAVGADGRIARFVGGFPEEVGGSPTGDTLWSVTGTSHSDVWVGGNNGFLSHWDGGSWNNCPVGSSAIRALWTPGAGVVYAASDVGKVYRVNSSCGSRAATIPGATAQITALAGSSTNGLLAIAGTRVYLGHR